MKHTPAKGWVLPAPSLLVISICIVLFSCNEKTAGTSKVKPPAPEMTVAETGLGDLKIGMTIPEVEKALNAKVKLLNKNIEDVWVDSANVTYRNEPVMLFFDRHYNADDTYHLVVGGIKTTSPKFKTATGIGVGSDKHEVWENYHHGFVFNMFPDFEDTTYTTRSKTREFINVSSGDQETMLFFTLNNDKITIVEVTRHYSDAE